jgi:hypothetical protein
MEDSIVVGFPNSEGERRSQEKGVVAASVERIYNVPRSSEYEQELGFWYDFCPLIEKKSCSWLLPPPVST